MNLLEEARNIILKHNFDLKKLREFGIENIGMLPDEEAKGFYYNGINTRLFRNLTPQVLADALNYCISIETTNKSVSLGQSKFFGHPHLPRDFKLDVNQDVFKFWFQLNFKDLKTYDKLNLFPSEGLLSVFTKENENTCKCFFFKDNLDDFIVYDQVNSLDNQEEKLMEFNPYLIFYIGEDTYDYSEIYEIMPKDLLIKIEEKFKMKFSNSDSTDKILGRPIYWQGEDEQFFDEENEENDDFEFEEKATGEKSILLFQSELDDASLQLWISEKDLKNEKFEKVFMTSSSS